jgi:limonene-1,2-epoxide hydrolase
VADDNIAIVEKFCAAFARRDSAELIEYFADGAVYHNMPMAPVTGKDAIKGVLDMFLGPATSAEFVMLKIAAAGDAVLTERVDKFAIGGASIELPVAGVFELKDGKITAWRDYFDMATWTKQATPGS